MVITFEQHTGGTIKESAHRHKSFIIDPLYCQPPDLNPAHRGVFSGMLLQQLASDGQRKVV
jgi:hypothetical protein